MKKRSNIIIINPDQMRADSLAHLGNPASVTPNIDSLAEEGVSFSSAFCQNPVCTPSRCSFMSGWYPHVAGHRTMTHMMHEDEPVLLKFLKNSGYHVWMNQRNDLLPAQKPNFYEDYCDTYFTLDQAPEKLPDEDWRGEKNGDNFYSFFRGKIPKRKDIDQIWVEGAVEFIENYNRENPFCIFLPLMQPHPVYQVSEPYFSRIDRDKLPDRILPPENFEGKSKMLRELNRLQNMNNWSEEQYDELRAVYLGMCSRVDDLTGMVLNALKEKGIYDDTAVFFFSDHGDYTGDYNIVEKVQNSFEDCLTNVPFIVKLPKGMQKRTGVSNELVELIDFYATAREVAGLEEQHTHFGKSLIPYMQKEEDNLREAVFCEGGFRKGEDHCKETGGQGTPTPERLYYPRQLLQVSDEMYNGKAIMCRTKDFKYVHRLYEQDELYDLQKDPFEVNNRIEDLTYQEKKFEMKEILLTHYIDTCDVVPFEKDTRMDPDFIKQLRK